MHRLKETRLYIAAKRPNAPSRPILAVSIAAPFSRTVSNERTEPCGKIGVLEKAARIANHVAEFKLDRLEMGIDTLAAGRLQGAEQSIAPQAMINLRFGHCVMLSPIYSVAAKRQAAPAGMSGVITSPTAIERVIAASLSKKAHRSAPEANVRLTRTAGIRSASAIGRSRLAAIWLPDKELFDGRSEGLRPNLARNTRIFIGGQRSRTAMGQFQTVHASGHVDVREQQRDIRTGFQKGNCFVRVTNLKRHETRFLDDFDGKHPQERIILYDENDGPEFLGGDSAKINDASALSRRFPGSVPL